MKKGKNLNSTKMKKTFFAYINLYQDDGRKIVFTFNVSGQNTSTIHVSDIACFAPPYGANPHDFFFVKNVFGFVKEIDVTA